MSPLVLCVYVYLALIHSVIYLTIYIYIYSYHPVLHSYVRQLKAGQSGFWEASDEVNHIFQLTQILPAKTTTTDPTADNKTCEGSENIQDKKEIVRFGEKLYENWREMDDFIGLLATQTQVRRGRRI